MDTIYNNFIQEVNELEKHLEYIIKIKHSVNNTDPLYNYINSTTKKKFNYKSLIISIYGIIEFYSENFLKKYLEILNNDIPNYIFIKDKIQENNLYNSANLALKVIDGKHHKYSSLSVDDIIHQLNSCLTNQIPYVINSDSFTISSGNLKHNKICDLFKQLGINIEQYFDLKTDFKYISSANKYQKIDDIVERRNEISHGALGSILDTSEFPDYIDFIKKYFKALWIVLKYDLLQEKLNYHLTNKSIQLETITLFPGNIIGFENVKRIRFRKIYKIVIKRSSGELILADIEDFKIYTTTNQVTLKLKSSIHLRDNQEFYLIKP